MFTAPPCLKRRILPPSERNRRQDDSTGLKTSWGRRLPAAPFGRLVRPFFHPSSEWIVRLYPNNRRAGDTTSAKTEAEAIPPSVPLNTERYQPKQRQALSRTNPLAIATTMGFQRDESLWAHPLQYKLMVSVYLKRRTDCCPSSEWIVWLYPDNRRAGDTTSAKTEAEAIPPPVPPKTERYQPKLRQTVCRTNPLAAATTMGFQRDESLWAHPP